MSSSSFRSGRPASGRDDPCPDPALAVCARGLAKRYVHPWTRKVTRALEDFDLDVCRGEVLGVLGPNGAGKTTTLKILTGLLKPNRGQAWLLGEPVTRIASRRSLGFLPEQPYFYDYLTGLEFVELAGRLCGLEAREARRRALHWLDRAGLGGSEQRRLRQYSKGMLQRIGLAAALVHDPELLILDEPMSGLDPRGRRDVRDLILEARGRGVTVLFSSHIIPDVEVLSDRVAIVAGGRLVRVETVGELIQEGRVAVEIVCGGHPLLELPHGWADLVTRTERANGVVFRVGDDRRVNEVVEWLVRHGVALQSVLPQRVNLEDLYVAATAGDDTEAAPARRAA